MKSRPFGAHVGKIWLGFMGIPEELRRNTAISLSQSAIEIGGWESGSKPVSIRISIDLIARLQRDIASDLNGQPSSGVTGLLLGQVLAESTTLSVDDYELAHSTPTDSLLRKTLHSMIQTGGPPIARDEQIQAQAQRWRESGGPRRVLGFFRMQSGTQPVIDRRDLKGAWRLLPPGSNVFLLIGSDDEQNYTGMLFFRKNRRAKVEKQFAEFSFDADVLRAGQTNPAPHQKEPLPSSPHAPAVVGTTEIPVEAPAQLAATAAAAALGSALSERAQPPVHAPSPTSAATAMEQPAPSFSTEKVRDDAAGSLSGQAPPKSSESESASQKFAITGDNLRAHQGAWPTETPRSKSTPFWRSWLSIAVTWTIAVGATMWFTNRSSLLKRPQVEHESRPAIAANPIGLRVDANGPLLNVAWDRKTATVLNSNGGYMIIRDGQLIKMVHLDPIEIRTGHIYYSPRNADVGIVLEVGAEGGDTASESLRILAPPVPSTSTHARP